MSSRRLLFVATCVVTMLATPVAAGAATAVASGTVPTIGVLPSPLTPAAPVTAPACGDALGDLLLVTTLGKNFGVPVPAAGVKAAARPIGLACSLLPVSNVQFECSKTAPITGPTGRLATVPGDVDAPAWLAESLYLAESGSGLPPTAGSEYNSALGCKHPLATVVGALPQGHIFGSAHAPRRTPSPGPITKGRAAAPPAATALLAAAATGRQSGNPRQPTASVQAQGNAVAPPTFAPSSVARQTVLGTGRRALGWSLAALALIVTLIRRRIPRPIR